MYALRSILIAFCSPDDADCDSHAFRTATLEMELFQKWLTRYFTARLKGMSCGFALVLYSIVLPLSMGIGIDACHISSAVVVGEDGTTTSDFT